MTFTGLLADAGVRSTRTMGDADVGWISADSRACRPGSVFVCAPSRSTDSHSFLGVARQNGAVAAVVHSREGFDASRSLGLATVEVDAAQPGFNEWVAKLARALFADPSAQMRVIGVTGTNGKTTTAWMLRDALRALGRGASYLGTLGFDPDGERRELANTTPFPVDVWQLLHEAQTKGVQDFVMEASSHALLERRVHGVRFACGVFTNLSQDHLDYHTDMREYADAKRLLFTEYAQRADTEFRSAINIGDPAGGEWARISPPTVSFGAEGADLTCRALEKSVASLRLEASFRGKTERIDLNVGGTFNVWNATAALATLIALGTDFSEAAGAMTSVTPVPGRFESVPTGRGFSVIVDYAHTEDALRKLLQSVRDLAPSRIVTVFGCGGDRDRTKRPKMARAVSENSEVTIVTSDNPRTEDPDAIIQDVLQGIVAGADSETVPDRPEAILRAMQIARDGDVVVIAGKGHEDYQIIGRTKFPMDDRALVRDALEESK